MMNLFAFGRLLVLSQVLEEWYCPDNNQMSSRLWGVGDRSLPSRGTG